MSKKKPVDNSSHYRKTGQKLKDHFYNKIVDRYGAKGNVWQTSDSFVWRGAVYEVPQLVGYVLQLLFFWWLAMISIKYRGDGDPIYGVILILIFVLVRFGMILKQQTKSREELETIASSFK